MLTQGDVPAAGMSYFQVIQPERCANDFDLSLTTASSFSFAKRRGAHEKKMLLHDYTAGVTQSLNRVGF